MSLEATPEASAEQKSARLVELERRAGLFRGPEVLSLSQYNFDLLFEESPARKFERLVRGHEKINGVSPSNVYANIIFKLPASGRWKEYSFRVKRVPRLDRKLDVLRGDWTVEWWPTADWSSDPAKDIRVERNHRITKEYNKHSFSFVNAVYYNASQQEFRELMLRQFKGHSSFPHVSTSAGVPLSTGGFSNDEARVESAYAFAEKILFLMDAVENYSMGPYRAALSGAGDFEIDDPGHGLTIDVWFRRSAFNGRSMLALAEDTAAVKALYANRSYATLRVKDNDTPDGRLWFVAYDPDDQWTVGLGDETRPVKDGTEAYRTLYGLYAHNYGEAYAESRKQHELTLVFELPDFTEKAFVLIHEEERALSDKIEAEQAEAARVRIEEAKAKERTLGHKAKSILGGLKNLINNS